MPSAEHSVISEIGPPLKKQSGPRPVYQTERGPRHQSPVLEVTMAAQKISPPSSELQPPLQTTITQQTFDSFGGSAGSPVQISVRSQESVDNLGCPNTGNSAALLLVIN